MTRAEDVRIFSKELNETDPFSESILMDRLLQNYDYRIRPDSRGKATRVFCEIVIDSIDSIDVMVMEYTINIRLRQWWMDGRFRYDDHLPRNRTFIYATPHYLNKIWRPNIYFTNENHGHAHNLTSSNVIIQVYQDGKVWYSVRLTLTLSCPMWLAKYPMDNQTCPLELQSYMLSTDEQLLYWVSDTPVRFENEVNLPQFKLEGLTTGSAVVTNSIGNFSNLDLKLRLRREMGYHLLQSYGPLIVMVMVSWVSFWLDVNAVVGRSFLGVMTLLTVNTITATVGKDLPIVSYAKAIDIWTGACATFVFCAFLEYAAVSYYYRRGTAIVTRNEKAGQEKAMLTRRLNSLGLQRCGGTIPPDSEMESDVMVQEKLYNGTNQTATQRRRLPSVVDARNRRPHELPQNMMISRAKHIDLVSRIVFPLVFLSFNIGYWISYVHLV